MSAWGFRAPGCCLLGLFCGPRHCPALYRPFLTCLWLWETGEGDLSPLGLNSSVLHRTGWSRDQQDDLCPVPGRGGTGKSLGTERKSQQPSPHIFFFCRLTQPTLNWKPCQDREKIYLKISVLFTTIFHTLKSSWQIIGAQYLTD